MPPFLNSTECLRPLFSTDLSSVAAVWPDAYQCVALTVARIGALGGRIQEGVVN